MDGRTAFWYDVLKEEQNGYICGEREEPVMAKTAILYHSGVGSTRLLAEALEQRWRHSLAPRLLNVQELGEVGFLAEYDNLVFGFPCYHAAPSPTMRRFVERLPIFASPKRAFVFTSCGLYSGNALRGFAKLCRAHNIVVVHSAAYRCPASDGILLKPDSRRMASFGKRIQDKLAKDAALAEQVFAAPQPVGKIPAFRLSSILNAPNKLIGGAITRRIHLIEARCVKCGRCAKLCPYKRLDYSWDSYPVHKKQGCENCYRCVHVCPRQALTIQKNKPPQRQLTADALEKAFGETR